MCCPLCQEKRKIQLGLHTREEFERWYKEAFQVDVSPFFSTDTIQLCQCLECKLIFFEPVREADGLFYAALAQHEWYYAKEKYEFEYAAQVVLRHQPRKVLEVGCGRGYFLDKIRYAAEVSGLEQNPQAVAALKEKGIAVDLWESGEVFDLVVAFQVLEHVANPQDFLETLLKKTAPGGHILLTVPNPDSAYMREVFQYLDCPPHHLTRWPKAAFQWIAAKNQLEVEDFFDEPITLGHYEQLLTVRHRQLSTDNQELAVKICTTYPGKERPLGHTHGVLLRKLANEV